MFIKSGEPRKLNWFQEIRGIGWHICPACIPADTYEQHRRLWLVRLVRMAITIVHNDAIVVLQKAQFNDPHHRCPYTGISMGEGKGKGNIIEKPTA